MTIEPFGAELDLSVLDLSYLSEVAQAELDEAAEAVALAEAAEATASCTLFECVIAHQVACFVEALGSCGLTSVLRLTQPPSGGPRLIILAPSDAAMQKLPPWMLADRTALYRLCSAHVCTGGMGAAMHSLQGTVHCTDGESANDGWPTRVGHAHVVGVVPFSHGTVILLDAALWVLDLETEARSEQVWQKAVVPAPQVTAYGPIEAAEVEFQAQLYHVATGSVLPEEALRGCLVLSAGGGAADVAGGIPQLVAVFKDLVIEHKPASAARKKATSIDEQRMQQNAYGLTYTLVHRASRRVLCAVRQPTAVTLRNSYHTLSETEKAFRREYNSRSKPSPTGGDAAVAAATAAAAAASSTIQVAVGGSVAKKSRGAPLMNDLGSSAAPSEMVSSFGPVTGAEAGGEWQPVLFRQVSGSLSVTSELSSEEAPASLHMRRSSDSSSASSVRTTPTLPPPPPPPPPPRVFDICPKRGTCSGGTEVWLHGEHLHPGVRVCFGESEAVRVVVCSPSLLKCITTPCTMGRLAERVVEVNLMTSAIHSAADEGAGGVRGRVEAGAQDDEGMLTDTLTLAASAFVYFAPSPEDGSAGMRVRGADGGEVEMGAEMGGVGSGQGGRTESLSLKRRLASILERIDDSLLSDAYDEWGAHHGATVLSAANPEAVATDEPADETDEPADETDEPADETTDAHLSSAHRWRLLTLAAVLSTRDEVGWCALHYLAALGAARALAALLVRPGCPWDARDAYGHCPLQRALEYGQSTAAQLLCLSRARLSAPWVQLWRTLATALDTATGPSVTGHAAMYAAAASPSPAVAVTASDEPAVAVTASDEPAETVTASDEAAEQSAAGARAACVPTTALPLELQALSSAAEASTHAFRVLSQQAQTLSSAVSSAPGSDGGHSSGGRGLGDAGTSAVASARLSAKSEHLYQRLQMAAGRGKGPAQSKLGKGPAQSKHGAAGPQDWVDGAEEPNSQLCSSGVLATSKSISAEDGGAQQMDNESRLRRLQRAFTPPAATKFQ